MHGKCFPWSLLPSYDSVKKSYLFRCCQYQARNQMGVSFTWYWSWNSEVNFGALLLWLLLCHITVSIKFGQRFCHRHYCFNDNAVQYNIQCVLCAKMMLFICTSKYVGEDKPSFIRRIWHVMQANMSLCCPMPWGG